MSTAPTIAAAGTPTPLTMAEVLRFPVMRRLWIAQIVSTFGDFLALFAVIAYITYSLHGSPEDNTGLQIAYMLPIAVLGVLAGVFVDRWALKPTMVASDFLRAGLCLLLLRAHSLVAFYAIMASVSVLSSFFGPAQGVAIRAAVPLHGLRSANSLMQQVMFGMRIVGMPVAGLLYYAFSASVCFVADAVSFVCSGLLILSIALTRPQLATAEAALEGAPTAAPAKKSMAAGLRSIGSDMRQGLSFIFHHAGLLFVILAFAAGMFILGCFAPLIAIFVRDSLHAPANIYGYVSAMIGLGMFLGVNALNTLGKKLSNTLLVYSGLGGIGVGLCMLAFLTPQMAPTFLALAIVGASVACIIVPATTLMQQETPPALMGRVGSTFMSVVFAAQIIGLALSGQLANRIGVRHTFAVCAAMLAVLIVAGKLFMEPKPTPVAAQAMS